MIINKCNRSQSHKNGMSTNKNVPTPMDWVRKSAHAHRQETGSFRQCFPPGLDNHYAATHSCTLDNSIYN